MTRYFFVVVLVLATAACDGRSTPTPDPAATATQVACEEAMDRADEAERLVRAHSLVTQGQAEFEDAPLLGLRLALEGLALAPAKDTETRTLLADSIRQMAELGRLLKLGGDIEAAYAAPGGAVVVLDRTEAPDEIRRLDDGSLVTTLSDEIEEVDFSPDPKQVYFVLSYVEEPPELRRTSDGSLLATNMSDLVTGWKSFVFSPDPDATYLVLNYADAPDELRRTADGALITVLPDDVDRVFFSLDPDVSYVVLSYHHMPGELRRTSDGSLIMTLNGEVVRTFFSPDADASYCAVDYRRTTPDVEIRSTADGLLISGLAAGVVGVTFSSDPGATRFVVDYGDKPGELRRTMDASLIMTLTGEVDWVSFSPDPNVSCLVVDYEHAPDELRRGTDGQLLEMLPDEVAEVHYTSDPDASRFIIDYENMLNEPRNTADGSLITFKEEIDWDYIYNLSFSPDPDTTFFIVTQSEIVWMFFTSDASLAELGFVEVDFSPAASYYQIWRFPEATTDDGPLSLLNRTVGGLQTFEVYGDADISPDPDTEHFMIYSREYPDESPQLLHIADGSLVATLNGSVERLYVSPDPDATYFVVDYSTQSDEIRRTADGAVLATLTGEVNRVSFSPDPDAAYCIVDYADGRSELWERLGGPYALAELGLGQEGYLFDSQNRRMLIWYTDGRSYLLDLEWLRAMGGEIATLPVEELETLACQGPFASGLLDTTSLKLYLGDSPLQICR